MLIPDYIRNGSILTFFFEIKFLKTLHFVLNKRKFIVCFFSNINKCFIFYKDKNIETFEKIKTRKKFKTAELYLQRSLLISCVYLYLLFDFKTNLVIICINISQKCVFAIIKNINIKIKILKIIEN